MIYKETGQYKSSYKSDHAIFPLLQDKIAFSTLMFIAFLIIPFVINSYWEKAILSCKSGKMAWSDLYEDLY